ncbi:MAG: hypothetical protein ACK5PS_06835 [Desulfopila sp.]
MRWPWWLSVGLAIASYCLLKYGASALLPGDHRLTGLLPLLAPLAAIGLLLLAAKQLYDTSDHRDSDQPGEEQPIEREDP